MKTFKLSILGVFVLLISTTGCIDNFTIKGNGIETVEERNTSNFNKVKSSGNFVVHITKGDILEVTVNAEQNIIPYIETFVSNNVLSIEIIGFHNIINRLPMEVYITVPSLTGISQSGSGTIVTDNFTADHLDLAISGSGFISTGADASEIDAFISGSGKLDITGEANIANFNISGSGKIDSYDLTLDACNAKISGSGHMWVNAEQSLHAIISGSGNVFYSGNPEIEVHISGSGQVIHEN
jgi:hypothetical protein